MAAVLMAVGAPSASGRGGSLDFGDAPDGAKAGYLTKPAVIGRFPSKLASGGPRHAGVGSLRLGPTNDGEKDSHQVDRDIDDGASLSAPKACKTATLTTAIKGSATVAAGKVVYVNAWFDWNRDGDWADPTDGCAPEWGVRNLPVAASSIGSVAMLPIKLVAGKQVKELWYRVTITLDEVQIDPSGRGRSAPYLYGETEDYLLQDPKGRWITPPPEEEEEREKEKEKQEKNEKFTVRCIPKVRVIAHGGTATFGFLIGDKGKGNIVGEFPGGKKGKGFEIKVIPSPNQGGVPPGFVRSSAFRFKSKDVDPPTRIQKVAVKVSFKRGKFSRQVTCTVIIVHVSKGHGRKEKHGKGKGKHEHVKPPKIPSVKCKGGCGGQLPTPPPKKTTTLTDYDLNADGSVRVHILPTDPLESFTIPLYPPNPVPRDPPKVTAGNQPIECELVPLQLTGGPAAERCTLLGTGPPQVDSFFDIFYDVQFRGETQVIEGTLNVRDGTPLESFSATLRSTPSNPTPSVNGSGNLSPGPNPQAVDFSVQLDVENEALNQFAIQLPPGTLKVASGNAPGFNCAVVGFGGPERTLACNGPVGDTEVIQGVLELTSPRLGDLGSETHLFGSPGNGIVYGPFDMTQTPAAPSGSGVFSPGGGPNDVDFTVNLDSFGALNQFTLNLPPAVQVQSGSAMNAGAFACNPVVADAEANNALQCQGQPIVNGEPITGTMTLMAPPPVGIGSNSQLFGNGPGGPVGPFAITDAP
ncbi:MAG: GEVED domain-containing protein [Solirubrobacterales bacterium]